MSRKKNPRPGRAKAPVAVQASLTKQTWILAGLLVFMTLLAYQQVWHCGFIWDDDSYIIDNVTLRSWHGLWRIWTEITATPQYYPLVHTSFWVEYHLWGLNPLGFHVVNVCLHAVAVILLWRLLLELELPGAWLAAAIFAVHPLGVESVAWITERKNVLSAVFYFSAALAYFRFSVGRDPGRRTKGARWFWYIGSLTLFVFALLSKTVTCSLPAALLLVAWWKTGRLKWREVFPLVPFFVIGLAMGIVTAWIERHQLHAQGGEWALTFGQRILIAGRVFWFYAGKLFWPDKLTFIYPRWAVSVNSAFPAGKTLIRH